MIKFLKERQRDLSIIMVGIQEAVIEIADHVNQYVQKIKRDLESKTLEGEIKLGHETLGRKIYRYPDLQLNKLYDENDVQELIGKIAVYRKKLDAAEGIVSPYEAVHDFERLLIRSNFVVQSVVISDSYPGLGKTIAQLGLPSDMLIFFIKKSNKIELAWGKVRIAPRDEVTFLCSKEDTQNYISFWK